MKETRGTPTERITISTEASLIISRRKTREEFPDQGLELPYDIGVSYLLGYSSCSSYSLLNVVLMSVLSDLTPCSKLLMNICYDTRTGHYFYSSSQLIMIYDRFTLQTFYCHLEQSFNVEIHLNFAVIETYS